MSGYNNAVPGRDDWYYDEAKRISRGRIEVAVFNAQDGRSFTLQCGSWDEVHHAAQRRIDVIEGEHS